MIGLLAERGIGEPDVAVAAGHNIVRSVQALAFPLFGDHFGGALLVDARDAARAGFAGVEPAFGIEGIAAGAVGVLAE